MFIIIMQLLKYNNILCPNRDVIIASEFKRKVKLSSGIRWKFTHIGILTESWTFSRKRFSEIEFRRKVFQKYLIITSRSQLRCVCPYCAVSTTTHNITNVSSQCNRKELASVPTHAVYFRKLWQIHSATLSPPFCTDTTRVYSHIIQSENCVFEIKVFKVLRTTLLNVKNIKFFFHEKSLNGDP